MCFLAGGVVSALLSSSAFAQLPAAAPAPAAVPVAGVPGGPAVAPAAPPTTLWSFLGISKAQKAVCKDQFCKTQLGMMVNNGMAPINTFTGGIIPPCCPPFSALDLLNSPAGSVNGVAAAVAKDEAEAKARIQAIRYLANVDCRYWPEAQDALRTALREDRVECVRFEAALALNHGCCCTPKIMEALAISASGSDRDGAPGETSPRVKASALTALENCLSHYPEAPLGEPEEKKKEEAPKPKEEPGKLPDKAANGTGSAPTMTEDYYKRVGTLPREKVIESARRTLAKMQQPVPTVSANASNLPARGQAVAQVAAPAGTSRGHGGLVGVINDAFAPHSEPRPVSTVAPPLAAQTTGRPVVPPTAPAIPVEEVRPAATQTVPVITPTTDPTNVEIPMPVSPYAPRPTPGTLPPLNSVPN
jgi:hypothetical protein